MVVIAQTANRLQHQVGAVCHCGRHAKAGPEQDEYRGPAFVEAFAKLRKADSLLGAGGGMHQQRARSRSLVGGPHRVFEFADNLHQLECFAPATIEGSSELEFPVIDNPGRELPLLRHRMHDKKCPHSKCATRARQVVDIQAGDRGGDDAPVAIDHRMMNQRKKEISHVT